MSRSFTHQVRVYWADTDAGGVVYHSNYLDWCEQARTECLRSLGISQQELAAREGLVFTVVEAALRFRRPARLDDLLTVRSSAQIAGGASVAFRQEIWREAAPAELLVTADVRVACVDAAGFRPRRIPESIRKEFS
jgi:acyl-CoA thioester hydrolase